MPPTYTLKPHRRWPLLLALALVVAAGTLLWRQHLKSSALATALEWSRLGPLPPEARDIDVQTRGGMFTREFIITFTLPPAALNAWLAQSPGTADADRTPSGDQVSYRIRPYRAQYALLEVDHRSGKVRIRTYWS
jgi:hypothetical protein